jgi:hypothetical protein
MQTVTVLAELGVADAIAAIARNTAMVGMSRATLHAKAKVLQRHGLDAGAILGKQPHVLGLSVDTLDEKLQWLSHVASCYAAGVESSIGLLTYSLHGRLRPRFFLPRQLGVLDYTISTLTGSEDAVFLKQVLRGTPAADWSVEAYQKYIASPAFVLYMDSEEAALRAKHAAAVACGAAPVAARRRVRSVGVRGAKNAAGQPLLDPDSVAFLSEKRVYDTAAAVETMLYTRSPNRSRYPFETVKAANAWLEAALEGCSKRVGGSDVAGVTLVVRKLPALLWRSVRRSCVAV